ncbi:MAG TPA: hypothetical protein VFR43_02190 [Gaiellaceae bacterium]|nr:hypothetical protein [Gaiellaceae bacterium]
MRLTISILATVLCAALVATAVASPASSTAGRVVVPRGQPVQIAFTAVTTEGELLAGFTASFRKAIRMAIALHPTIRGFPVKVNAVETSCSGDNAAAATAIVANEQNTAVIGHLCSDGFVSALPIYEAAGIVTVSGSATRDGLPALGPSVFNRVHVRDGDGGEAWYELVRTSPRNVLWRQLYLFAWGSQPEPFADLYFDAARLLLARLEQTSAVVGGNLVVDRAALARAVRNTSGFFGVTCAVDLDPATGNRVNDPESLARCTRR